MRLGQLARKLALRPSQIVDYLATIQVFPDEGSNARLSDEDTGRIIMHFAPDRFSEILTKEEKIPEPATDSAPLEEPAIETRAVEVAETHQEVQRVAVDTMEEKPEVIKAPKVELTGLKVLGKIELPETKKKVVPASESVEEVVAENNEPLVTANKLAKTDPKEKRSKRREIQPQRSDRNPIAEQRERKAREEEEKRKAKAEREKEKRTQYYLQRVKTGQPTKAVKIIEEPTENFELKEVKPAPKTWLGKFLRWLNT
jgi:hypothetical protein